MHVNKRLNSRTKVGLPLEALISQYKVFASNILEQAVHQKIMQICKLLHDTIKGVNDFCKNFIHYIES